MLLGALARVVPARDVKLLSAGRVAGATIYVL
jgi:hypothetical protein